MQKTLTQMNVQLANVISYISGATGMAILVQSSLANAIPTSLPAGRTA